jgi:hypothetical protein
MERPIDEGRSRIVKFSLQIFLIRADLFLSRADGRRVPGPKMD